MYGGWPEVPMRAPLAKYETLKMVCGCGDSAPKVTAAPKGKLAPAWGEAIRNAVADEGIPVPPTTGVVLACCPAQSATEYSQYGNWGSLAGFAGRPPRGLSLSTQYKIS